jgi:hypothetical protein
VDFTNERYVRVYTRDTVTWKRLGWDGQCILLQLLRKVDRAGTVELDGLEPWEAISLLTGAPEQVARAGTAKCLTVGTIVISKDRLVLPKFIEAQEALKSDKQRQRESRERRAALTTPDVTNRDSDITPCDETSQPVTAQPDSSQPVTIGHSVLCSAVPSSAVPDPTDQEVSPEAPPAKGRKPKSKDQALEALKTALSDEFAKAKDSPPALTQSLGRKACDRIREFAKTQDVTVEVAARLLVTSYVASGAVSAWKLLDVPLRPKTPPANGQTGFWPRPGAPARARPTTGADFADADPIETQLDRIGRQS